MLTTSNISFVKRYDMKTYMSSGNISFVKKVCLENIYVNNRQYKFNKMYVMKTYIR